MNEITLKSLSELHEIFAEYVGSWFRGQADIEWQLLPKVGRKEYYMPDNVDLDSFKDWKKQAIAYTRFPTYDIECLAIAQHHGLATRLLDWSKNPLIAAYFAVNGEKNKDGVIFILECADKIVEPGEISLTMLRGLDDVLFYVPKAISPRILSQHGVFTIHCKANRELGISASVIASNEDNLVKLIIPKSIKQEVVKMLDNYGINESFLFPDLDGLSRQKNREVIGFVDDLKNWP
ncbi:MAG: type I restriction enzyme M protein [Methyloprofundus sp.]|nr:MAG: type I restriction enzyme M protein [Methyloprofundus sp.]